MVLRPSASEPRLPHSLARANSDFGSRSERHARHREEPPQNEQPEENWELRHGFEEDHNSEEYLNILNNQFYMYYTDKRHETGGKPRQDEYRSANAEWRQRDRVKTFIAALQICLNIGVDPPDVVKTDPAAKLECWIDPASSGASGQKTLETIGKQLQAQYESLSIRTRYKQVLDPSIEDTKKCCVSLRRNARDERILFHYNGHGVPLPTTSGEIWYFNKSFTQYIPVSLYDLQAWLASPTIYVFDVSHAGNITDNFERFNQKHLSEAADTLAKDPKATVQNYSDNIILAACGAKESLPTNPDLPADMFTSCLTTPVTIALRCFVLDSKLPLDVNLKDLTKIPGRLQERRTPLGELNWIFTAVTDTIAWNTLPTSLFKKLFRQDLMVAALFRNYLLAERLMRFNDCHPITIPALPRTHDHPLWSAWDLAIEMVLNQLPALIENEDGGTPYEYQHSTFFAEQLTAFEVYLTQGAPQKKRPDQLPIVLQVLLSQVHRLRALILLSRFLDLGPWAVDLALNIGIFPYVLKLLQSSATELKPVMIFIWTRLLAVDQSSQPDLLRDNGFKYFMAAMRPDAELIVINSSEHRAMSTFIITMLCRNFQQGQAAVLGPETFQACIDNLQDTENPLLRQWSCLCISILWKNFPEAKWYGMRVYAHDHLCDMSYDPVPEVRAAALHALGNFIGIPDPSDQVVQTEGDIAVNLMSMTPLDGSSMVRIELVVFFSVFVKRHEQKFMVCAFEDLVAAREKMQSPESRTDHSVGSSSGRTTPSSPRSEESEDKPVSGASIQATMWKHICIMSVDPHPEVAEKATMVVDYVHAKLLNSPLEQPTRQIMAQLRNMSRKAKPPPRQPSVLNLPKHGQQTPQQQTASPPQSPLPRTDSYISRTFSAVRSLTFGSSTSLAHSASKLGLDSPTPLSRASTLRQQGPGRSKVPAEWSRPPDAQDPQSNSTNYQPAKAPAPRGYQPPKDDADITLPLTSGFLEWCIEYFREPQMKPNDHEEPGSDDYNSRLWRRMRNERTLNTTQPLKSVAGTSRWDIPEGSFNNGGQPTKMCFHQFEDHLIVADDRDTVSVWNWQEGVRLNRFSNGNPAGSRISEARFINEDDQALLMTGSSDGVVRLYRDYDQEKKVELISTFRGVSDLISSTKNAGLVLDWQQGQGKLLCAGDMKVIRVWNAATEVCVREIPARSGSCITSITSDQVAGNVFVAGYGDGAIRVFDQRKRPVTAMTKSWRHHKQWIVNVHMQRGGMRELVSGSRNGEVKLWDLRMDAPIRTIVATKDMLRTLSVHEHAPIFATGSDRHHINFFNVNSAFLNSIDVGSRFLHIGQQHRSPVASTVFHPHKMTMAYSALGDTHVNLFTCLPKGIAAQEI
ncbi:hypothetical protein MMC25_005774 [Agyrium rufum]|nr:hypothetical protein [Agyrium rufum]